jgi:hypothetical protein
VAIGPVVIDRLHTRPRALATLPVAGRNAAAAELLRRGRQAQRAADHLAIARLALGRRRHLFAELIGVDLGPDELTC